MSRNESEYSSVVASQWADLVAGVDPVSLQIMLRLRRAVAHASRLLEVAVQDSGLSTYGDFEVLSTLRRAGPLSPSELASRLLVTRAAITGRLSRLEVAGLVRRERIADDRRAVRVKLTGSGRSTVDRSFQAIHAVHREFLAPLNPRERQALDGALLSLMLAKDDVLTRSE